MSIAFYIDENVHRGITDGLRLRDVDVLSVQEDGYSGYADPLILDRATQLDRVLSLFCHSGKSIIKEKRLKA